MTRQEIWDAFIAEGWSIHHKKHTLFKDTTGNPTAERCRITFKSDGVKCEAKTALGWRRVMQARYQEVYIDAEGKLGWRKNKR